MGTFKIDATDFHWIADKIEAFYKSCTPKKPSTDEFEWKGYTVFWNEWNRRRYGK